MKNLFEVYPDANAYYDVGKYYGVAMGEDFYLVDKKTLQIAEHKLRYESDVLEMIEKAVPIAYAEDDAE